ncbi:uncharacterized protein LOC135373302 [Ornithodoros turicata]|uniref:uncharacterized protein LOC135373302 n=1 Tax=Ornithodoros turicata TaxID=34597 RepID=UPI003138D932
MDDNAPTPLLSHFAIKLPQFIRPRPGLWFSQAECQFTLGHITSSTTKFHHVMSVLPEDVLIDVADILSSPPSDDPYVALKNAIISRASPSDRESLRELTSNEPLGDRKPSQLLRRLRFLPFSPPPLLDTRILRKMFLSKLPSSVQMVLSASEDTTLEALAERADELMELGRNNDFATSISALQSPSNDPGASCQAAVSVSGQADFASLRQQVRRLADLMEDFRFDNLPRRRSFSPRPPSRSRPRRDSSPNRANSELARSPPPRHLCWYHSRFRHRARRCEAPCGWQENFRGDR